MVEQFGKVASEQFGGEPHSAPIGTPVATTIVRKDLRVGTQPIEHAIPHAAIKSE
jgi:hypothetical protein